MIPEVVGRTPGRDEVAVPARVTALARDRAVRPVWLNQAGGLTFAVGADFVKWHRGPSFAPEAARLRWASRYAVVPRVLCEAVDGDEAWLVTAGLPGRSAVDASWRARPRAVAEGVGRGLRALHDALPVLDCPFSWSAAERVADVHRRRARLDPSRWHREHRGLSVDAALGRLAEPPPVDRLVVCHGDACAPNTLLDDDGRCSGHVDLGALGVADRWADLAVATWSLDRNLGPGWDGVLLDAYGTDPDPTRTAWYRLLWDLGP